MNKLPKSIESRILEINNLIPLVDKLDEFAFTYAGGTWPYYVNINPIEIKGLKVTIKSKYLNDQNNFVDNQKYNCKKIGEFEENGLSQLKHDLSIILKALKKALK
jgi:hypothetical protein